MASPEMPDKSTNINQTLLLPVKLDAFVFNKAVCNGYDDGDVHHGGQPDYRIAPITQPNYSFLRLDEGYIQKDIMQEVDLHNAWPADINSRFTDLATWEPRRKRQGVYLHWTLPRVYRSGITKTKPESPTTLAESNTADTQVYPEVPTRWLVIRKIDNMDSIQPAEARESGVIKTFAAWVVESDRVSKIDDIPEDKDLQVEFAPFIHATEENSKLLKEQAEVFIGNKTSALEWSEKWRADSPLADFLDLKLLGSSNELFPDYQPHCSNIFSIMDNFEYGDGKYIEAADVSYYVIGWHANELDDLLNNEVSSGLRKQKLSNLKMDVKGSKDDDTIFPPEIEQWLASDDSANTLVHGAIYNVNWNLTRKPKTTLAADFGKLINKTLPISVGTSPIDALITYAEAHKDLEPDAVDLVEESLQPQKNVIKQLDEALIALETYLMARDDGVESQTQAADMLYNWNYLRLDGGKQTHIAGNDAGKPMADDDQKKKVQELNKSHRLSDAVSRRTKQLQALLFSEWWKYVTLGASPTQEETAEALKRVKMIQSDMRRLKKTLSATKETSMGILEGDDENSKFQDGTRAPFYQQRDPTLLVGGVQSGWEWDFLDNLKVRLDCQVYHEAKIPVSGVDESAWSDIIDHVIPGRGSMHGSAINLFREFLVIQNKREDYSKLPVGEQMPLFHSKGGANADGSWRDSFSDTQPWFPLFMEWEVEYYHVDYENWRLDHRKLRHQQASKLHYIIDPNVVDLNDKFQNKDERDVRKLSGRALILPQPTFSLKAKIQQLFDDTPEDKLNAILSPEQQTLLKNELHQLAFLSAPLAGFTSHLLTIDQGNHVKPILKVPQTGELKTIPEAIRNAVELDGKKILEMGVETDVTPYGTSRAIPQSYPAFKPVTHGQFRFTRLNIVDKFGQAISAINPTPAVHAPKLWPCIAEWYEPQTVKESFDIPNVIERDGDDPKRCEFIQLPPMINQPARLNANFVVPSKAPADIPFWRVANEWDNPIWGWVVVNYANYGLQFFLADGTFYREVRLAGPNGSLASPEWLPFAPPENVPEDVSVQEKQLALLIESLTADKVYLPLFVQMINDASAAVKAPPSAYAEFTSALIGRPLAFTNMGWSLELDVDSKTTQLSRDKEQKHVLLPSRKRPEEDPGEPGSQDEPELDPEPQPEPEETIYEFKVKIGDKERAYDGLISYFEPQDEPKLGNAFKFDKVYTHFVPYAKLQRESTGPIIPIQNSNYLQLKAYWTDPAAVNAERYDIEYNRQLQVVGALVDPFTAVHAYTGILPIKDLALPAWTWQASMERMKAFFHAGPVLVTHDVPAYDPSKELKSGKPVTVIEQEKGVKGVGLPSISTSQWAWLQPYWEKEAKKEDGGEGGPPEKAKSWTKFMPVAIDAGDEKARLEEGPYTALEGYLQLVTGPNETADGPEKS